VYASKRSVVFSLAPILCALSAFPQAGVASNDRANQLGEEAMRLMREKQIFTVPTFDISEYFDGAATSAQGARERQMFDLDAKESPALGNKPGEDSEYRPSDERLRSAKPADFNRNIYYRNKLEFSLEGGWHPINVPFPLDVFVGDNYNTYPLKYTLVPIIGSLRWHMGGIGGPWILRGNFDLTFSGSVAAIPRGPESRYFSYIMGVRRNFVPRNSRIAPYFDIRLGVGNIDAKGPRGVPYAQGEDLTFTVNMGSGVRYNLNPRYAISAGLNFMHISNLDLSEGNGKPYWGVRNYGINVYGPMVGIDIQLRNHQSHSMQ
jgi:Lipid A 3-O-deacylase (PagL)